MNIVKSTNDITRRVEDVLSKTKDVVTNVVSHLPFANIGKKDSNTYTIEVDLPGVKKEDIELKIEDGYLRVSAKREFKKEVKEEDYYMIGSYFGEISRVFALPEDVDRKKIDAKYEDGRLYITLEKEESKKAKTIKIK